MRKQKVFTFGWKLATVAILASLLLSMLGNVLAEPSVPNEPTIDMTTTSFDTTPVSPVDPGERTDGPFTFIVRDGEATVTGYTGSDEEVDIPSTLGGYPVTEIRVNNDRFGGPLFQHYVTHVTLPEGLKTIAHHTFSGCDFETITLPSTLVSIGYNAFGSNSSLKFIFIPKSVQVMEADYTIDGNTGPFAYCSALTDVYCEAEEQPEGWDPMWTYDYYGEMGFAVHWGASRSDVPYEGVEGDYRYIAANGEATVTKYLGIGGDVKIPSTLGGSAVTAIGDEAFIDRDGLASVEIPDSVTAIGNHAFFNCIYVTSVKLPSGLETIGNYAFFNCDSLTSIALPAGVTTIGTAAFGECASLTSITVQEGNVCYEVVNNCLLDKRTKLLLRGCDDSVIPEGVKAIGEDAFSDCGGLASAVIPKGVTSIGSNAFWKCVALENVTIPDSVKAIGDYAFGYCSALESVVIPDSVTEAGYAVFARCDGMTIYCEADAKPAGWDAEWVGWGDNMTIQWGCQLPESPSSLGDVNGDGTLNANDYMMLKRYVLHTFSLTADQLAVADINADGDVNANDYMILKRAVLGTYKLPTE